MSDRLTASDFKLPLYADIPNVGLYLKQVVMYINDYIAPISDSPITESMISNYVKMDIIDKPVKKQYNREQIAYLLFISFAKSVLSMDNIKLLITMQKQDYSCEEAYEYLRREMGEVLAYAFGEREHLDEIEAGAKKEKILLRSLIITMGHKLYLENSFKKYKE